MSPATVRLARLVLPLLLAASTSSCDTATNGGGGGRPYVVVDDKDDFTCPEDPAASGLPVFDIRGFEMEQDGKNVVATVHFMGDIEAWDAENEAKLPISLQLWFGDLYVETFFKSKIAMKVADGKASVSFEISGHVIKITLTNLDLGELTTGTASVDIGGFDYGWTGLCSDHAEIDTSDPDSITPKEIVLNNVPGNNANNSMPADGPRYIMLTDSSPTATGDFPGSDIDRIDLCKGSDCTMVDVVAVASPEVVNSGNLTEFGGSAACDDSTYVSLGGGYIIGTFSDPSIVIEEGDSIQLYGLGEFLCAAAGPDTEQTYQVSVGSSEAVDSFVDIGPCGASVPCRNTVPSGI